MQTRITAALMSILAFTPVSSHEFSVRPHGGDFRLVLPPQTVPVGGDPRAFRHLNQRQRRKRDRHVRSQGGRVRR